jgi:hypothetical protein
MSLSPHAVGPTELDVYLRGDRDYVQGTQLIARACEVLSRAASGLGTATFHRITSNQVGLQPSLATRSPDTVVGRIELEGITPSAWDFVDLNQPAPRRVTTMGISTEMSTLESPLNAVYRFDVESGDLESILNVLVQSIRALHQALDPLVHDVWFTGMRRFPIPLCGWPDLKAGAVRISRRRVGRSGDQYQSLVESVIEDAAGIELCRGFVTFAFKSPKVLYVH